MAGNKVSRIEKNTDLIIGAPYSSTPFSKKLLINWFALGIPWLHRSAVVKSRSDSGAIRALHTLSDHVAKGTNRMRQVIDSLTNKSYKIEFVAIVGHPNAEVIDALYGVSALQLSHRPDLERAFLAFAGLKE